MGKPAGCDHRHSLGRIPGLNGAPQRLPESVTARGRRLIRGEIGIDRYRHYRHHFFLHNPPAHECKSVAHRAAVRLPGELRDVKPLGHHMDDHMLAELALDGVPLWHVAKLIPARCRNGGVDGFSRWDAFYALAPKNGECRHPVVIEQLVLIVTYDNDHVGRNLGEFFTQSQNSLLATLLFRLPNLTAQMWFQFLPGPALFEAFVIVGSPLELQRLVFSIAIGVEMPDVGGGAEHRAV